MDEQRELLYRNSTAGTTLLPMPPEYKFTPSPTALVRVVDGKSIKIVPMNRAMRRRLKVTKVK